MQPDPSDPIRAYIRANRDRFTPEAIRSQLIAAGHDPTTVEAVWREEPGASPAPGGTGDGSTAVGLASTAWVLYIAGAILGAFGAILIASLTGSYGNVPRVPIFFAGYAVAYLGLGYLLVRLVGWATPQFGIRGWWAVLVGIVMVPAFGALMFGTCAAASTVLVAEADRP